MDAEAVGDDAFARTVWERLIAPRRDVVRSLLIRARERGEVGYGDEDFLIDLVYGPMRYRLLFTPAALDAAYAAHLAETVTSLAAAG